MIKAVSKALFLFVSIFFLILPGASLAEDKEVTVTGKAPITGSKNQAQKEALKEAFRSAVEKGIGVWIKSETEVKNAMTVKDQILAKAEGYVKDYEVIKEGDDAGEYFVTIRAKVSIDQIGADFGKLLGRVMTQLDNPSITFALTTWNGNEKLSDASVLTSFQQEFKDRRFNFSASEKAMAIATSKSLTDTTINIKDRSAVRKSAEEDGANYVARGEVQILGVDKSTNSMRKEVGVKLSVEIIDVGSGDGVGSYTGTIKAADTDEEVAQTQAIMKVACQAAKTLANQVLETWQQRVNSGRSYKITVKNIKSASRQRMPIIETIESLATIRSQTSPQPGVLLLDVFYQGSKANLGRTIFKAIGNKPGFETFEGPDDEAGNILFEFK